MWSGWSRAAISGSSSQTGFQQAERSREKRPPGSPSTSGQLPVFEQSPISEQSSILSQLSISVLAASCTHQAREGSHTAARNSLGAGAG